MNPEYYRKVLEYIRLDYGERQVKILQVRPTTKRFVVTNTDGFDIVCCVVEEFGSEEVGKTDEHITLLEQMVLVRVVAFDLVDHINYFLPQFAPTILVKDESHFTVCDAERYPTVELLAMVDIAICPKLCSLANIFDSLLECNVVQAVERRRFPIELRRVWQATPLNGKTLQFLYRLIDEQYYDSKTTLVRLAKVYRRILQISQLTSFHTCFLFVFGNWFLGRMPPTSYDELYGWLELYWKCQTDAKRKFHQYNALPSIMGNIGKYGLALAYPFATVYAPSVPPLDRLHKYQAVLFSSMRSDVIPTMTPTLDRSPLMAMVDHLRELLDEMKLPIKVIDVIHLPTQLHQVAALAHGRLFVVPNSAHKAYLQDFAYPHQAVTLSEMTLQEPLPPRVVLFWAHMCGLEMICNLLYLCSEYGSELWLVGSMLGFHPNIYTQPVSRMYPDLTYGVGDTFTNLLHYSHRNIKVSVLYTDCKEETQLPSVYHISRAVHDHISGWLSLEDLSTVLRRWLKPFVNVNDEGAQEPLFFFAVNNIKNTHGTGLSPGAFPTRLAKLVFDTGEVLINEPAPNCSTKCNLFRLCRCFSASLYPCPPTAYAQLRDRFVVHHNFCDETNDMWGCPGFAGNRCKVINTTNHHVVDLSIDPNAVLTVPYWRYTGPPLDRVCVCSYSGIVDVITISRIASITKCDLQILTPPTTSGRLIFKVNQARVGSRFLLS